MKKNNGNKVPINHNNRGNSRKEEAMSYKHIVMVAIVAALAVFCALGCGDPENGVLNNPEIHFVFNLPTDTDAGADDATCDSLGIAITGVYGINNNGSEEVARFPEEGSLMGRSTENGCEVVFRKPSPGESVGEGDFENLRFGEHVVEYTGKPENFAIVLASTGGDAPEVVDMPNDSEPKFINLELKDISDPDISIDTSDIENAISDLTHGNMCAIPVDYHGNELSGCTFKVGGVEVTNMENDPLGECPEDALYLADQKAGKYWVEAHCSSGHSGDALVDVIPAAELDLSEEEITCYEALPDGELCTVVSSFAFGPNNLTWDFGNQIGRVDGGSCVPLADMSSVTLDVSDCTDVTMTVDVFEVSADLAELEALTTATYCFMVVTEGASLDSIDVPFILSPEDVGGM